jgi:hypothetical protein
VKGEARKRNQPAIAVQFPFKSKNGPPIHLILIGLIAIPRGGVYSAALWRGGGTAKCDKKRHESTAKRLGSRWFATNSATITGVQRAARWRLGCATKLASAGTAHPGSLHQPRRCNSVLSVIVVGLEVWPLMISSFFLPWLFSGAEVGCQQRDRFVCALAAGVVPDTSASVDSVEDSAVFIEQVLCFVFRHK